MHTHLIPPAVTLSLAFVLLTAAGGAQSQAIRELQTSVLRFIEQDGSEFSSIKMHGGDVVTWSRSTPELVHAEVRKPLGLAQFLPAGAAYLGSDRRFLVSGRVKNGSGVLAACQCKTKPSMHLVVHEVQRYARRDFAAIAWNANDEHLYAIDFLRKTIARAAWAGPGKPLPDAFTDVADATLVPLLKKHALDVLLDTDSLPSGIRIGMARSTIRTTLFPSGVTWQSELCSFWPVERHGRPHGRSEVTVTRGSIPAQRCRIAEAQFAATARASLTTSAKLDRRLNTELWIAVVPPQQKDPIARVGTAAVLRPDIVLRARAALQAGETTIALAWPLPLPNDAKRAGSRLLFQILVEHPNGQDLAFTDVFGATLSAAAPPEKTRGNKTALGSADPAPSKSPDEGARLQKRRTIWKSEMDDKTRQHVATWTQRIRLQVEK